MAKTKLIEGEPFFWRGRPRGADIRVADDTRVETAVTPIQTPCREDRDDDVLTVKEAARLLRMGQNSMYDAIGRLEIPHRRIGKTIRLSRAALERWLAGTR